MTAQQCTICTHPEHESIDSALGSGQTLRSLADRYGVSRASLSRHGQHGSGKAPALVDISGTPSRKFSAWGQVGDRLEELTVIVGKVGQVGAQRQDARLVLQAARTEIDTLIRISERLPKTPDEIFTEAKDRTIAAVAKALTAAVTDQQLLDRLYSEIDAELVRSGIEAPAEVSA
ncbi:MAG: hypothetical protein WKF57_10570 [Nakamurella sp.]